MPAAVDPFAITMYRGDSYALIFTFTNPDGSPKDLTDVTAKMTVDTLKDPPDDTTKVFELTGVIALPASGIISFTPSSVNTNIAVAKYYYDVELSWGANVKTYPKSTFTIVMDITKTPVGN